MMIRALPPSLCIPAYRFHILGRLHSSQPYISFRSPSFDSIYLLSPSTDSTPYFSATFVKYSFIELHDIIVLEGSSGSQPILASIQGVSSCVIASSAFPLYIPNVPITRSITLFSLSPNFFALPVNMTNRLSSIGLNLKSLNR